MFCSKNQVAARPRVTRGLWLASVAIAATAVCPATQASADDGALTPQRLRCEYRTAPLGVDNPHPELSWIVVADEAAQVQTAYRVLVASTADKLAADEGDLWDSWQVESDATFGVRYEGQPLASHQQCYWKVQTWDAAGDVGPWSEPALWTVGILDATEWTGEWIGNDQDRPVEAEVADFGDARWIWHAADPEQPPREQRVFVRTWELPKDVQLATATITVAADDNCTVHVNGHQVAFTRELPVPMRADVRPYLQAGDNEVRVVAANGAGPAGLLLAIDAETAAGDKLSVVTDDAWRSASPAGQDWRTMPLVNAKPVRDQGPAGSQPWGEVKLGAYATAPPAYLRSDFTPQKEVRRATAYLTALGWADLYLNGQLVNRDYFSSGWTDYNKRVYYRAYEVTDAVRAGDNLLGIVLADGWYSGRIGWGGSRDVYGKRPRVRMMLRLEYEDGSVETVATDKSWTAVDGPTQLADILIGEEYDARAELQDWNAAEPQGGRVLRVRTGAEVSPTIQWHPGPPVVEVAEFPAEEITEPAPGVYVFDLGQNFAGVVRLKVRGRTGQQIQLRYAERLNEDGTPYTTNLRFARVIDRYTCRGDGEEVWQPRHTFHGFQYVEVTGLDEKPTLDAVTGIALASATPIVSEFECSDPTLNRLYKNVLWTQLANFIDVPTDCPQRDERLGWTGDAQVYVNTACVNCDVQAFFRKWLVDLSDAQRGDGQFPKVAPVVMGLDDGGPAWADAGVICPWTIYEVYGDRTLLEQQYPSMTRFVEFCRNRSKDGVLPPDGYHCFGDWLSINADTPKDVIYTAYFANAARVTAQAAVALGHDEDAAKYRDYYESIKQAFNDAYVGDDGVIRGDTQCGYVLALAYDLLDGERQEQAKQHLVDDIRERGWHLSTGFIGTKDLMLVLSKIGEVDVALKLLHQDTFPGWGFSIKQGATSIWERWDGWTPERGFQDVGMNSFAHYSFGAVYGWMVENLGGIRRTGVAYQTIELRPQFDPSLDHCEVIYDSIRGPIRVAWERGEMMVDLAVEIPANSRATLVLERRFLPEPAENEDELATIVSRQRGPTDATWRVTDSTIEADLPSGRYQFSIPERN